jgi:hypothetical protein
VVIRQGISCTGAPLCFKNWLILHYIEGTFHFIAGDETIGPRKGERFEGHEIQGFHKDENPVSYHQFLLPKGIKKMRIWVGN